MIILKRCTKSRIVFCIIIVLMSVLVFTNIGNRYMFIDESIEAMLGKNILKYGVPKAWDGKNLVLAEVNGNEFNEDLIYVRKNWLSNYIAAFGQLIANTLEMSKSSSVTLMRCLFALIGVGSAIAYYYLIKEFTSKERVQLIALALYAFSVNVLLYIRSVYYLSPTLLFIILSIFFYMRYTKLQSLKYLCLFVISAILLFHSFYPYFLITMFNLFLVFFMFDLNKQMLKDGTVKKIVASIIVILIATVPWYIYARLFLSHVERNQFTSFALFWESLLGYVWQIHTYFFPFIPFGFILLYLLIRRKKGKKKSSILHKITNVLKEKKKYKAITISAFQILINLVVICATTNFLDTRRLLGAIPFLFFFLAVIINFVIEHKKVVGYGLLVICLCTNLLHISPYLICKAMQVNADSIQDYVKPPVPYFNVDQNWLNKKMDLNHYLDNCFPESNITNYLEEIFNNYDDADEGIVKFLETYGDSKQKVMIIGYQYETVAYYTDCIVVNRLDAKKDPLPSVFKHYPNAERYEHLTGFSVMECEWIIERRLDSGQNNSTAIQETIWHDESLFERYYIDYPDAQPWNEIWDHSFVTDDSYTGVYIYRNKLLTDDIELPSNIFSRE